MKTIYDVKYKCETCGIVFSKLKDAEVHEHLPLNTIQYVDNKPTLGKAVLEAVAKDRSEEFPYEVLVSYNGKCAWYKFKRASPGDDGFVRR